MLAAIAVGCGKLERLFLAGAGNAIKPHEENVCGATAAEADAAAKPAVLTERGFCDIATISTLRELDLSFHAQLRDEHIEALAATAADELRTLRARCCTSLTDRSARSLAHFCPNLIELDYSGAVDLAQEASAASYTVTRFRRHRRHFVARQVRFHATFNATAHSVTLTLPGRPKFARSGRLFAAN